MLRCRGHRDGCEGTALLYQKEAEKVRSEWVEVKREIDDVEVGSPEYVRLIVQARQLRDEYQGLVEEARRHHRAELPPLPVRLSSSSEGGR
jgi:hypothetical protein